MCRCVLSLFVHFSIPDEDHHKHTHNRPSVMALWEQLRDRGEGNWRKRMRHLKSRGSSYLSRKLSCRQEWRLGWSRRILRKDWTWKRARYKDMRTERLYPTVRSYSVLRVHVGLNTVRSPGKSENQRKSAKILSKEISQACASRRPTKKNDAPIYSTLDNSGSVWTQLPLHSPPSTRFEGHWSLRTCTCAWSTVMRG